MCIGFEIFYTIWSFFCGSFNSYPERCKLENSKLRAPSTQALLMNGFCWNLVWKEWDSNEHDQRKNDDVYNYRQRNMHLRSLGKTIHRFRSKIPVHSHWLGSSVPRLSWTTWNKECIWPCSRDHPGASSAAISLWISGCIYLVTFRYFFIFFHLLAYLDAPFSLVYGTMDYCDSQSMSGDIHFPLLRAIGAMERASIKIADLWSISGRYLDSSCYEKANGSISHF